MAKEKDQSSKKNILSNKDNHTQKLKPSNQSDSIEQSSGSEASPPERSEGPKGKKSDVSDYITYPEENKKILRSAQDDRAASNDGVAQDGKGVKGDKSTSVQGPKSSQAGDHSNNTEPQDSSPGALPEWTCKVDGTPKDKQWTVGEVFHLECEGPSAEFLSTELTTVLPEKKEYQLKILDVEKQTDNLLLLKVTSYNSGRHGFEKLEIADQKVSVVKVKPFGVEVKSIIKDPKQKPYGPAGAFKMAYPSWLWLALGVSIIVASSFSIFKLRRRSQMKKVIDELKQHNTALGPFNQFNKDVRRLGRQYIFGKKEEWPLPKKERYIESLDEIFRMYILREFWVPALDWNSNLIVKTISKQDKRGHSIYGNDLLECLKELDRAKMDTSKLKNHDCKQLTQMTKKVSQSIWKVRKH